MDRGQGSTLILLDEGAEREEQAPPALSERLAFHIDLTDVALGDLTPIDLAEPAQSDVTVPDVALPTLTTLAARFGIDSLRAPLLALRCARAHAAWNGRSVVDEVDITAAAELVFPHRATQLPQEEDPVEDTEAEAQPNDASDTAQSPDKEQSLPDGDMLIDAVKALLPSGLLDQLTAKSAARSPQGSGSGEVRKGNRRGRPLPPRPGRLDGRARIDLVATLRAAAPWQTIRRRARPEAAGPLTCVSDGSKNALTGC